ncbi:helix-turn-helix domain-containing protein [Hymenobacter baengnokdamensis]|uniref:helix-turn-helix domain-containing protein n=1 Tax=Hymenobacter baengnokdamensis TaxID=2615203 RepID=UPI0012454E2A|nr:helix-turn-helix domain-containing protein [Hymenobacter baengnokdamensis]
MQTIITQGFTLEQLLEAMRPMIRHELAQAQPAAPTAGSAADELLTVQQAASLLDVCVATIHEWKRRGVLVYSKIGGRTYLKRSEVLAAGSREQRTVKPSRAKGKPPA